MAGSRGDTPKATIEREVCRNLPLCRRTSEGGRVRVNLRVLNELHDTHNDLTDPPTTGISQALDSLRALDVHYGIRCYNRFPMGCVKRISPYFTPGRKIWSNAPSRILMFTTSPFCRIPSLSRPVISTYLPNDLLPPPQNNIFEFEKFRVYIH